MDKMQQMEGEGLTHVSLMVTFPVATAAAAEATQYMVKHMELEGKETMMRL